MQNTRKNTIDMATVSLLLAIPILLIVAVFAISVIALSIMVPDVNAVDTTWGSPPHAHEAGWPEVCNSTNNCGNLYEKHIQAEMNWFDFVSNLSIRWYPLVVDGAYGSKTKDAVWDYQTWDGIQIDGAVGNQTRSSMEYSVFALGTTPRMSSSYGTLRFPIFNTCKAVTVNSGPDVLVPTKTSGEWTAFINNKPGSVSVVNGDCSVSGGGGGSSSGGGGSSINCGIICADGSCGYNSCTDAGCTAGQCSTGSNCLC